MSYEIIGETIKSATSIKLGEIFNNPIRYKENVTNPRYPSFWIIQVQLSQINKGLNGNLAINNRYKDRMQLDYLMNIQYRVAENTESITNLQQTLDEVGLKLCTEFKNLDLELPTKIKNAYYEKADGVLQFFFTITVCVTPELTNTIKMNTLQENFNIKEDE